MWIIDALKLVGWQALQATLLFVAAGWLVIANLEGCCANGCLSVRIVS